MSRILGRRLREHPADAHARLYLALMRLYARQEVSRGDFEEPLAFFNRTGDRESEFFALLAHAEALCFFGPGGECLEGLANIQAATSIAELSGEPVLRRLAAIAMVRWCSTNLALGDARKAERELLDPLGGPPPPWLAMLELTTRASLARSLDEPPREVELFTALAQLSRPGSVGEATALTGRAAALSRMAFLGLVPREEAVQAARSAYSAQQRLGLQGYNNGLVGLGFARDRVALMLGPGEESMRLLETGDPGNTPLEFLSLGDARQRRRALELADRIEVRDAPFRAIEDLFIRTRVLLRAGEHERGRSEGLRGLEVVETILDRERGPEYRMSSESVWTTIFHGFASTQLESSMDPGSVDVEVALQTMERFRAHGLLEALLARSNRSTNRPGPPTLGAIATALDADEALVSFEQWRPLPTVWLPAAVGSSWAIVVTPSGASAFRIPDADVLEPQIRTWTALVQQRDPAAASGARRLHAELFAPIVAKLPPSTRKLVLVLDGQLHRLPFDALSPTGAAPFLADQYSISIVPSAAVWLQLRGRTDGRPGPALALASGPGDPWLEHAVMRGEVDSGLLQPLARARDEAREAVNAFGPGSRLLEEGEATTSALRRDLQQAALVHVAAHAVVDEAHPAESFLLLAPGENASGKLRVAEIPTFDWAGKTIVLSACETSLGSLRSGEGVLSLARGFFAGGASAVLGTLGKVRDDEQYELFHEFYAELRRGISVGDALSASKRTLIRRGAPPAAWANVVLLGDSSVRPHRPERWMDRNWWLFPTAGVLSVVAIAGAFLAHRRRHARR